MLISQQLPESAVAKFKKGDFVSPADTFYTIGKSQNTIINITKTLGVDSSTIFRYMVKVIGEEVTTGEVLAQKKGLVGRRNIKAPLSGVIMSVSHQTGQVVIGSRRSEKKGSIVGQPARFRGEIEAVDGSTVTINIQKGEQYELDRATQDLRGESWYLKDESLYFTVTEADIANKIVIVSELKNYIAAKLEALGCLGLVTTHWDNGNTPMARLTKDEDWERLTDNKRAYCIVSKKDLKMIAYD